MNCFQEYGDFSYFDNTLNVTPLYQPDETFDPVNGSDDTHLHDEFFSSEAYEIISQATFIAIICGIVLNGLFVIIFIQSLRLTPRSEPYARVWLTFALLVTHTFQLITQFLNMYIFPGFLHIENQLLGMLIYQIPDCLDLVAVLTGVLLTYNIFQAIYMFHAATGTGRRSTVIWVLSTAGAWVVGFVVNLSITLPIHSSATGAKIPDLMNILLSLVMFVFPYMLSLLFTCLTLRSYFKATTTTHVTKSSIEPDSFQNNDNTPRTDERGPVNHGRESMDADSKKSMTCWVIFNAVVVFLGFLIRLPLHLSNQDAFRQTVFNDRIMSYIFWNVSFLGSVLFIAVFPLLCLIIMEVRKVGKARICKLCFKLLCNGCCPENGDDED